MNNSARGESATLASPDLISERYEAVIGLEVHCQLKTASKLFCGCATAFGALPNYHTCPVCLGLPGALPVLNTQAVNFALRMALAVGAKVHQTSVFARKQYFYPDLPKGYQITQFDRPYCTGGHVVLGNGKSVRLRRIHMEEDAGKNVHGDTASYVDLNRAGIPLIEIVSEPDIRLAEDAADYLKRLRSLVRHLDISDGNLEEGSFRCDVNVSIRPRGHEEFGTRCEIKNLNSFKNIERAIRYEIVRQADILDLGGSVKQQTMLFDAATGRTQPMRSKEESHDYRFFPEPDLRPLILSADRIAAAREALPELPEAMAQRFQRDYGLSLEDAAALTGDRDLAAYFETTVRRSQGAVSPKIAANWVTTEFLREVNARDWNLAAPPLSADGLGELLELIGKGTISGKIAKTVFEEMVEHGGSPAQIVKDKGLVQIVDAVAISGLIEQVIADSPTQVAQFIAGKDKVFGYFVGQIMRLSGGKMNPALVNDILTEKLNARKAQS